MRPKTQAGKVMGAPAVLRMKSTFCVVHLKVRHLYQYKTHFYIYTLGTLKRESNRQIFELIVGYERKRPWNKTTMSSLGFAICQISPTLIRFVVKLWNDTFITNSQTLKIKDFPWSQDFAWLSLTQHKPWRILWTWRFFTASKKVHNFSE